ncbi:uncharacterized protein LOC129580654 isoform X3 [Paramacrobiotus metropolitanus]|uniref:uncharacterized protein LOC129580654 isoform X3 n=1 Tax=Paramacrobiotus metropolitanus TaxID=2943436 RepID=UPI00244645FE|nr:uncharacterized protein LOC129580654 isoform X3 [Paramacrobiotus metropolitanus]
MEQDLYERSFSPQRPRSRISSEYSGASTTHPVEWQDDWIHREEQFKDTINALHTEQERIQKKTFTNWINSHVEHHRDQWRVNDLFADLKDGRILLALLEVITGDYLPCETFRHYTRAHYLSNVERALDYLRHRNIKLVNINSSDVVDGNETVILGLIWTIILNFQIDQDLAHLRENFLISPVPSGVQSGSYEARSRSVSPSPTKKPRLAARGRFQAGASKAMLKWCQKEITDCYGIPITNLSSSWKDGMAFLGLVKVLDPKLINLNDYRRATPSERMNVAFTLAHEQLGIPKFLEVSDIDVDRPDERSIMTYIAQFIKRFPEAKRNRQKLIMDNFPDVEALEANEKADYERIRDWCNDVLLMLKCLELSEERPYEAYDEYKKFSENFRTNISSYTRLKERYEEGRTLHMTEQNILELDSLWARLISEKQIWHNHLFRVLLGQEQLLCSRFEKYESELDQRVLLPPQRVTHYSKVNLEFRVQKHEDILLRLTHLRDELNSFLVKEYPTEVFALHDLQSELNAMITDLEQRLLEERCKLLLKRQLIIVDEWERRIARWEEFLASPGLNGERLAYEFELHVVQERIFDKFLELSKQLQRCLEILQNTPESDKHQRAEFLSSAVNANRRWKRIGEQLYEIREKLREYQMLLKKKGQKVDLDYNGKDVPDISLSSTSPVSPPAYIKSDRWLLHIQKVAAFTRWIDRMERDFESIDRENVSRVEYQRGLQRFRALCNEVVEHKTDGQDIIDTFYNCSAELPHNVASEEQRKINRLIRRYDSLIPSLEIVRSEVERNVHAHQVTSTHTETVQLVPDRPESVREHAVRIHTPAARGLSPTVSGGTSGYATPEFENALLRRSEPTTPSSFNRSPPLAYGISSQSSVNEGSPIEPSLIRDIDIDDETQRSASAASPRGTPAHTPGADERTFVRDVPIMDSASGSATHLRPTVKITSTHRTVGALSDDEDLETKRIKVDQSRKGLFPKGTVEKFEQTVTETTTERSLRNVAPEESSKISTLRAAFEKPTESQQKFTTKPKPGSVYDALRRKSKDSDSDNEDVSPKKRPPATSSRPSSTFLRSADDELTRLRQRPAGIVFESDVSNADVERAMSETPVSPSSVSEKPKYLRNVKTTTLVTSTETKTVRTVRAKSPPASEDVPYLGSGRLVGKIKHPVAFTTETQVRDEPVATESKSIGKVRPAAVFTTPTDTFVRRSSQEDIPQSKVRSHIEEIHRRASQEDITSPGTSEPESTGKAKTPFGFLKKHTKTEFEETTKTVKRVTVSPLSSAKRGNRVEPATVVRDADEQGVASPVREEILASFVRDPERPPPPVVRESTVADPTQTFVRTTERVVLRPHRVVDTESQSESVVRVVPYGATATLEADTPKQVNRLTNLFERATTDPALMTTVVEQEKVERVRVASPEREERVVSHHVTRSPGDISVSERVRRYELPEEPREQTVSERTKKYDDIFAPLDSSPGHFSVMETSLSSPTSTVVRDAVVTEYPPEEEREELTTTIVTEETKKPKKGLFGLFRSKKVAPEESITVAKVKKEPVTYSEVNTETRTMVREDRQWDTADREVEYGIPRIRTGSVPHHAGVSDAEMDDTLIKNGLVEQAANWRDQYPTDVEEFLGTNRKPVELLEEHVVTRTVGTTQSTEVSSITRPQTFVRDAVPVLIETPSVYHEKRTEVHTMHPTEIPERERLVTANEFIEETADREVPKRTSVRDLVTSYETVSHTRQPTEPHPSTPMEVEEVISSRKRPSPVEHTVGAPDYDMKVHAAKRPVLPFATAEHMEESISKRKSEKPAPSDTVVRRSVSPPPILGELEHVEETIVRRTERKPRKPEQDTTFEETLTHPVGEAEPLVRPLDRPGFDIRHSSGPRDIDIGLVDERESAMIKSVTVRPEHLHAQSVDDVSETTRRHKKLSPERVSTVKTKSEVVHVEHVPGTVVTEVPVEEKTKRKARAEALVETEDSARRSRSPVFEQTEEKVHKIKMPKASEEGTNMISTSKVTESPVTTAVTHDNIHISEISHVKSRPEEIYHRGGHRDDIFIGMEDFRPSEISETSRKELHSETVHPRDYDVVTGKRHATPVKEHLQEQVINVDNLASTETRPREESAKISASKSRSPVFEHLEETVSTFTVKQPDERGSKKVTDIAREEEEISRLQQTRLTGDEAVHTVAVRAEGDAVHHHGGFGEVDRWGPGLELVPEPEDETDIRQLHPVQQSVDEHVVETDQTAKKQKPRTVKIREESVLVEHRPSSALSEIHEAQVKPVAPVVIRVPKTGEATMESLQESIVTTRTPREIEQQLPAPQQEVRFEEESAHRVRDETIYHHGGFGDIDRSGYGLELAPGTLHEESLQERKPVQQRSWEEEVTHAERKRSPQREIAKIHEENVFIEHRPSSPVPAEVSHVRQISAKPAPVRAPKPIEPAIESLEESVAVTKIPREREELQRAIPSAVSFHEEQMGRDVARVRSAEAIRHHGGFADIDRWGNLGDGREIFLEGRETVAKASVPVVTHDEARQRQRSPVKTVKVKEESVLVHRTASPMRDTFETVRSVAPVVEAVPARAPKPSELTLTQHEEFVTKEKAPVRAPAVPEAESGPKKSRSKTEKITHFVPLSDRGFESKLFSPTSKIREKIYQAEQETSSVSKKVKIFEDESGIEFGRAAEERMAELQSTRSGPTMTSGGQSADSKKRETSAFSFLTKQKSIDEMEVRREKPLTILESMGIKNEPVIQMETVPAQTFVPQYVIPHEKRISSRSRERETLQETITKTTTAPRSDVAAGQRPSRASLFELWHRTTPRDIDIATVDLDEQPHRHREDEVSTRAVTPASERIPKFVRMDEGVVVQQARSSSRTESETSLEGILRRSPSRGSPTLKTKSETVHVETRRTPSPNISKEEHSFSYETGKESRPRTPPVESLSESIRTHRVERTKQLGSEVKKVMSGGTSTVVKAEGEPAKVTNAPPTRYIQDIETPWVAEERPDSMLIRHRTGVRDDYIGGFGSDTEAEKPVVKPRKSRERSVERLEESVSEVSVPSLAKTRHRSPEVQLEHMDVVRPLDRHAQEIHTVTPEVQPTRADRSASKKVLVEETVVVTTRTSVKPPVAPVLEEDQRQRREHVAGDEYRIEESQSLPRPDGRDVWHRAGPRDIDIATVSIPVVHSHRKETVEMVIRPKESEEETVNIRHVASVHRPVETQEDLAVSSATKHRPAEERVEEFVTRSREPRVRPEAVEHVTGIPDREIVHEDETKAKAKAKSQSDTYEHVAESTTTTNVRPAETVHATTGKPAKVEETAAQKIRKDRPLTVETESVSTVTTSTEKAPKEKKKSGLFGLFKSGKKDKKKSESEAVTRVRDVTEESTERRESVSSSTASSVSSAREIQPPAETEYVEETVLPPRERPESVRHRSGLSDDRIANWTDPFRAAKEVPVTAVMQEEHRVVTRADETSSSESETDETHSATERRKVRTKKKSAPEAPTVVRSAEHVVEYEIPEVTEKPVAPVRTHKAVTVETLETGHAEEYLEPRLRPEQASHRAGMSDLAMDDYAIERLRVSPSAAPIETEREVIFTSKPGRETETIVREVSPEIIQAEHETVTEFTVPEAKERKKSKSIFGLFKRKSSKTAEPEVTTETHVSEVVESELSPGVQQYQTKTEEFIGPPQERPTSVHHRTGLTDNDIIDQFRHVALVETAEEKTVTLREAPTEEVRVTEQHRTKAIPAEEIEQETVVIDESEREKVSKSKSKGIFGLFKSKKSKETTAESVTKVRDESELEHIERTHPEVFQPVQLEELTGPPRERPDSVIHRVGYPDSEMERYIPAETVATPKPVSEEHISETVVRDVSEPVRRKDVEQVQSRIVGETLEVVHPSKSVVPVLIEAELPPRDRPHAVEHRSNLSDMEYESISRQYPGEVRTEVVETTRTHPHAEEYLDETLLVTESARPVVPSRKAKVTEEHEVIETLTPRDRPAAVVHRTGLPDWEIVEDHARMSPPPELQKIREESITIKKTPETVIVKQPSEEEMRTYSETVVTESEDVEKVKKEKSKSKGIFGVFKSKKSKEASSESVTKVRDESEVEYTERAHSEVMQPVRMEEEIVTGPPRDRPLPVNHRVGYPDWEMERHIPAEELVQQKAKDAEHISESVIVRETSEPALKPVVVDTKPVVERRVRTASRETLAIIPPPPFVVPEIIHSTAAVIVPPSIPVTKPVERAPVVAFPETLEIISAPELVRPLLVEPTQAIVVVPPPRPKPVVRETLEIIQAPDVVMPVLVESTQAVVVKPVVVETKPIILPAVKVASRESLDIISPPPLVAPLYIEPTQAVIVPFIPPVITKPVVERPLRSAERETLEIIPPPDTLMPVLIEPTQAVARRVLQPKVAIPQEEHFEETVTVIRDAPTPARRAKKVEVESSTSSESESEDESVVVRRARPASRVLEESILEVEEPMSPRERPSAVAHRFNVPDRDIIHLLPQETVSSHEHLQESVVVKSSEKTVKPAVPARTSKKVSISSESETEREAVRKVVSATETHHVTEVQVPRDRPAAIEHRYNVTDRDIAVASGLLLPRETLEENVTYSQQKVTAKKPVEERRTEEIVSTRVGIEPARMMPPPRVTTEHIVAEEPVLTPRMRPPFVVHPYGVPDRDIETISRRFPFPEETRPESEILQERVVTESVKTAKPAVPPRSVAEKTVVREDVAIMEERQPKAAPVQPERVEHLVPRERPPVIYHRGKFADYEIEPIASRYVPVAAEPAVEKRQEERVRSDTEHIHETVSVVTTTRSSSPPRTRAVAPVEVEEVHLSPRERPAEIHHPARLSDFEIEPLAAKYSPVLVPAVPVTEKRKVEERVPASEHLRETVTVVSTARVPSPTRTKIAPVEETEIEHLTPRERPPKIRHRGKNSDYDIEAIAAKYAPISAEPAVKPLKSSTTEYEHVTVTTKTTAEPSVKFGVSERSKMVKDVFAMEQGPPIVAARLIPAQISQEFVTVREVSPPIRVHRHEEEVVHLTPRERPAAVEHKAGLRDENINMFATRLADMTAVEGKKAKKVEVSSSSSSESESEQERVTVRKMRPTEKIVRDDTSSDEEFGRVHSERVRHVHLQDIQRKPAPTEEYSEMVVRTIEPTREAAEFPPRERPGKVQHFVGTSDVSLENALVTREPVTETDETLLEETVFRRTGAAPVAPKPAARKTKSEELFEESERRSRGEVIVQESELMKQKKFVKGRRSPSPSLSTSDTERKRPTKVLVKMDDMPTVVRSAESVEHREEASKKKSTIKIAQEEVIYTEQEEKRKQEALDRERELKSRTATPASISTTEAVSRSVSGTRSRTPDGSTKIKSVKVTKMKVEPKSSKSETKEYIYEDVNYYKTAKRSKTPDAISRGHTIATTSVASTSPEAQVVRSKTLPYQERSPDEVRESEHITATKVREVPPERERMEERVRKTEVTAVAVGKKLKKKRSQSSTSSSSSREDADEISSVTKSKLTSPTPEPRDDVQLALAEMKSKKVSPREESDEEVTVSRRHVVSPDRVASPPPILHHVTPGDAEIAEYLRHMRPFATGPYTEHEIQPTRLDVEQEHEAVLTTTTHVVAPVAARKERRSSRSSTSSTESEDEHGHKVRRKRRPVQKIAEEYVTTRTYPDEEAVKKQAGHRDSEIGVALIERTKTEQLPSYISFGRLEPDSPRRSVEYRSQDEYRDRSLSPYPRDKILHRAGPKDFQIDYVEMLAEPFKPPRRDKESMQTYYYGDTADDVEEGVFREVSHKRRSAPTHEMEMMQTATVVHPGRPEKMGTLEKSELRTISRESSKVEKPTTSQQSVTYVRESPALRRQQWETSHDLTTTSTPPPSGEYLEEHVEHYRVKLSHDLEELRAKSPKLYKDPDDIKEMRTVSGLSGRSSRAESSRTTSPAPLGLPYPPAYLVGRGMSAEREIVSPIEREKTDQVSPLKETQATSTVYTQPIIKKRVIPTRDSIEDDMVVADVRQVKTQPIEVETARAEAVPVQRRTDVREYSVSERERNQNRESTISDTATYMEIPERPSPVTPSSTAATLPVSSMVATRTEVRRSRSHELTPIYAKVQKKRKGYTETLEEDVFYWKLFKPGKKSYSEERMRARSPENVLTPDEIQVLQRSVSPLVLAEGDKHHRHKEKSERVTRSQGVRRSESDVDVRRSTSPGLKDSERFTDGRERYDIDLRLTTTLGDDRSAHSSLSRRTKEHLTLPAVPTPPRSRQMLSESPEGTPMHVRSFSPASGEFVSERLSQHEAVRVSSVSEEGERSSVDETSRIRKGLLADVESETRLRAARDDADMMYRAAMREPLPDPHSCLLTYNRLYGSVEENLLELEGLIVDPDCQYIDQELLNMEKQRFTAFLDGLVRINRDLDRLDDLYRAMMTVESGEIITEVDTRQRQLNGLYMSLLQQLKSILRRIRHLEFVLDLYRKRRLQFKVRLLEELTYFRTNENMSEEEQKERVNQLLEEVLILRAATYNMFVRSTPEFASQLEIELHEILTLLRTELRVPTDIESYYGSIIQLLLTGRYSVEFDATEQKLILSSDEMASAEIPTSTSRFSNPTVWSVLRRALPMQALALILLGFASLIPMTDDEFSCLFSNYFASSFNPALKFSGPPPI